jgi:hypothetical protein
MPQSHGGKPHPEEARPEIVGSAEFVERVTQSLDLLESKAADAYAIVIRYVGRIEQGEHSGMWAYRTPPTYEMTDRTAFYSLTWCAGTIAHDSYHSKLYHDHRARNPGSVPGSVWSGEEAELKCIRHQIEVMELIGAPKHEIEHCRQADGKHADIDKDGKYDWEDFKKRDW